MLAMPIKWEGIVEQCAGRLHRDYKDKKDVIIYDYVDIHIPMLERRYQSRLKTYKKIGYEVYNKTETNNIVNNNFFDNSTYLEAFDKDILNCNKEVIISSIGLSRNRVFSFINLIKEKQHEGVRFKVLTLSPEKYELKFRGAIEKSIYELENAGVEVI